MHLFIYSVFTIGFDFLFFLKFVKLYYITIDKNKAMPELLFHKLYIRFE
jgi:hypothetical protein